MKNIHQLALLAGLVVGLCVSTDRLSAQDAQNQGQGGRPNRGNFDPEQMRQRMMERMREQFDVKNDDEWKLISERIEKVTTARREASSGAGMGMLFGGGGNRPAGGGGAAAADAGGRRGGRGGFAGEPDPAAEALQKAIDAKASPEEIKAKLAGYRDSRKQKEAKLEKAQEELRQVLSLRQEATAVLMGLLK